MSPLSRREDQVLELARRGRSTKEIAAALGISTRTVAWHRRLARARQTASAAAVSAPHARERSALR